MKVSQAMTRDVCIASPENTLEEAACMMADLDAGALPIASGDRLIGMLTDRDITVRAVAQGLGPDTTIENVMSPEVMYCFEDEELEDVARNMSDIRVRRLPVLDRSKRLVGIVSLGDLAVHDGGGDAGQALSGISRPGGLHSQRMEAA